MTEPKHYEFERKTRKDDLDRLGERVENLKEASLFEQRACAEACLSQMMRVLCDFRTRIETLEEKK